MNLKSRPREIGLSFHVGFRWRMHNRIMKKGWHHGVLILAAVAFAAPGCMQKGTDLVKTGIVTVQMMPSETVGFAWVEVSQEGDQVALRGQLKSHFSNDGSVGGRVIFQIVGPAGNVMGETIGPVTYVGSNRVAEGLTTHPFKLKIQLIAPKGSTCRVRFVPA